MLVKTSLWSSTKVLLQPYWKPPDIILLQKNGETGKTGTAILSSFHSLHTYQALTARQVTRYVFLSTTYESNHWKHDGASWIHTKYLEFIAITDVISCPLTFYVWCIPLYINIYRYCMYPYVKLDCRYCMVLDSKSVFHSPIKPPFLRCVMRGFTKSEQCNTNAVLQTEFHLGPGENVPTSSPGQPMKASFSGILVPTIPPSSRSKQRTSVKLLHSEVFDPGDGISSPKAWNCCDWIFVRPTSWLAD